MNLCFDECLPPKWFRVLATLLGMRTPPVAAFHVLDQLRAGTDDASLVEWLRSQSPPIVLLSGDSGRSTKRGQPRLPLLCPQYGITSVFIAPKLCQRSGFEKLRMMIICLPELEKLSQDAPGHRYRLECHGGVYRVRLWPMPAGRTRSSGDPPRFRDSLFDDGQCSDV